MSDTWPRARIGDNLEIRYGKSLVKKERSDAGFIPVVGSAGRISGTYTPLIAEPAIIIGRKGDAGQVQLENDGCWPIDNTYYAAIPKNMDARFLRWNLHALNLGKLDSSTATPSLRREDLELQEILIPPLEEQRRIVATLEDHFSRLDVADDTLLTSLRRTDTLCDQLLERELDKVIYQHIYFRQMLSIGLTNGRSVPTREDGFPVLRLNALRTDSVDLTKRKLGAWTADEATRFLVQQGDFLIARGSGSLPLVGRGSLVVDRPDPVAFPDTFIRARLRSDILCADYLRLIWNSPFVRQQIERMAKTTAGIYKVSQRDLEAVLLPIPSLLEQRRIATSVRMYRHSLNKLKVGISDAHKHSVALRSSLLAAAFSGSLTGSGPHA